MSRAAPPRPPIREAVARDGEAAVRERLVLAWRLEGGGSVRWLEVVLTMPTGGEGVGAGSAQVRAAGDAAMALASAPVRWTADESRGLLHADAPGLVHATVSRVEGEVRVLYARTPLVERLGVGGGRYELSESRIESSSSGAA